MTKVYPNAVIPAVVSSESQHPVVAEYSNSTATATATASASGKNPVVLTVWKKSLLFNCDGFTVFDSSGNLVFRVDNYNAGSGTKPKGSEIVLMDASGRSLLTIRRGKRLSLSDNWLVYVGETAVNPLLSVTKHGNILQTKSLAHVRSMPMGPPAKKVMYEIQGSYAQRSCVVYDDKRRGVAEIKRKEAVVGGVSFGVDVFRLVVHPEMDPTVAMALVIVLDQMFASSRRFSP